MYAVITDTTLTSHVLNLVVATLHIHVIILSRRDILRLMDGTTVTISMEQRSEQDRDNRLIPDSESVAFCAGSKFIALLYNLLFIGRNSPQWAGASSFTKFLDHTRRTAVGRTLLDE
jgi:uncharacterized protein YacL (UPF0231 family)